MCETSHSHTGAARETVMKRGGGKGKMDALPSSTPSAKAGKPGVAEQSGAGVLLGLGNKIAGAASAVTGLLKGKGEKRLDREAKGKKALAATATVVIPADAIEVEGAEVVEEVDMDGARKLTGGQAIAALEAAPQAAVAPSAPAVTPTSQPTLPKINLPVIISLNSVLHLVQDAPTNRLQELYEILCADDRFNSLPQDESDVVLMAMSIKRLVEEGAGARAITDYIVEQIRLLGDPFSATILCNIFPRLSAIIGAAITDAQQELGGTVVASNKDAGKTALSAEPATPSDLQKAVAREAAAATQEAVKPVQAPAPEKKPEFPKEITFGNLVAFVQSLKPEDLRAGTSLCSLFNAGLETKPWAGLSIDERSVLRLLVDFRSGALSKKQLPGLVGEGVHSVEDPSLYLIFDTMLPEVGLKRLIADLAVVKASAAAKAPVAQAPAPKPQQKPPAPQAASHQQQAPVVPPAPSAAPAPKPQAHEASPLATLLDQLKASQNPIKLLESLPEAERVGFTGDELMALRVAAITRTNALRTQAVMGLPTKGDMGVLLQKLGLSEGAIAAKRAKESGAGRSGTVAQDAHRGLQQGAAPAENALFSEDVKAEMARILEGAKKREAQGSINRNEVWFALRRAMEVNPTCKAEFAKHQHIFWLVRSYLGKAFGRGWIEDHAPMFVRKQSDRPEVRR